MHGPRNRRCCQKLTETRALANKDGTVLPEDKSRKPPPVAVELTRLLQEAATDAPADKAVELPSVGVRRC